MSENGDNNIIELTGSITVRDLSQKIKASPIDVIKNLMANGVMANINQTVDFDTAAIVAAEFGYEVKLRTFETDIEEDFGEIPLWRRLIENEDSSKLIDRPPVVTILGHVDHGKTTLLDAIRKTHVAEGEAGGITQHIGAYQVKHNGHTITFLDTPGHAAFSAMRARGAQGADLVVLVIAADDGVMPQTKEAIAHARAAKVPMIVALTKMDRDNADPDRVKQQLAEIGLIPDEWEGDTIIVPLSAIQEVGLEDLLEAIILVSDNYDIISNPQGEVFGTVIEARIERGRGVMTTLLVQNGTLKVGDVVVAGKAYGRIKAMFNFQGKNLQTAEPSTPVSVMGLNEVPEAGDLFTLCESEKIARDIVKERQIAEEEQEYARKRSITLEEIFERFQSGETRELRLIIKADVQGSLEPIINSVNELGAGEIGVNILHADTGNISESDVMLASASDAVIVGFNVIADTAAERMAEIEGISIRTYNIIYRLTEDIEKALKGLLEPEEVEVIVGKAEVLAVFRVSRLGQVAGCRVLDGEIRRNGKMRVFRGEDQETIFEGEIASLKRHQDDVREVRQGFECGIGLRGFNDFSEGDILECFTTKTVAVI
ncbi:translation initiation factor IF-2 [bacterium SM23_57]|jgi:translation initiation factor IF-2|nr:MAG: translation initiation factor IF-2 [bacterium SM23_57]